MHPVSKEPFSDRGVTLRLRLCLPATSAGSHCRLRSARVSDNAWVTQTQAMVRPRTSAVPAYGVAAALISSGIGHFAAPERFDAAMPKELPGKPRFYTYGSGIVEVVIGLFLLIRRTRRCGSLAALVFFVLIFPAVANSVRLAGGHGRPLLLAAMARLPLQILMMVLSFKISRKG